MMFSFAWRWSSLTHAFALSREACACQQLVMINASGHAYGLCDIVDNDSAVCVPVVHGRKRLVALLASRVPNLELDCCVLVEGDGLGQEGGADGGFPVVVELVLSAS